jgi:hypothetical protein
MSAKTAQRFALMVAAATILMVVGAFAFGYAHAGSLSRQPGRIASGSEMGDDAANHAAAADAVPAKDTPGADDDAVSAANAGDGETEAESNDPDKEVRKVYPNSRVGGVFALSFARGSLYIAGVDTVPDSGQPRRTVDLLVRLYTRRNGAQYWRAESISRETASNFLKKADADNGEQDEDGSQHDAAADSGNP